MNYSDRFLAKISETKDGNTPAKVAESLRHFGIVEENKWPFSSDIDTFEKFYAEIPADVLEEAKKFLNEYEFLHEYVPTSPESLKQGLKLSPIGIGVPAWFQNEQGLYYRPEGMSDNHFTTLIGYEEGKYWIVFDSYENNIKHLDWNINSSVAKRFHIAKKNDTFYPPKEKETNWIIDLIRVFWLAFKELLKKIWH